MFTKVFSQIYEGTLATKGAPEALTVFMHMLVMGYPNGVVDIPRELLASRCRLPLEFINAGIAALEEPDPDSRTPTCEGRRITRLNDHRNWGWQIVNFVLYRDMMDDEARRLYRNKWNRDKYAKTHQDEPDAIGTNRDKSGQQSPVGKNHDNSGLTMTNHDNSAHSYSNKSNSNSKALGQPSVDLVPVDPSVDPVDPSQAPKVRVSGKEAAAAKTRSNATASGFLDFWALYPNRVKRLSAEEAWNKVNPERHQTIMAALPGWVGSEDWLRDNGQFIPHAATWINGNRWEDPPPSGVAGRSSVGTVLDTTPLPEGFKISEAVIAWAIAKQTEFPGAHYHRGDDHLENFITTCQAKGYRYANWDAAFQKAIIDNWAKVPRKQPYL